ncbi:TNT domain-containing protein [Actinotalea fermentans]|uniref:TNT domain-containing protein n=1 Tax=Actinotalea fermentans TaxID=43671 RepID=A0A511YTJ8_9CELL|nr:TNT domain-containing protein [Actinotalea fermentans]GEN78514.1 hypothetical protein AFE02nite_02480 [Actinotalea fermentans]
MVGGGCLLLTAGAGSIACGALGGAAAGAASHAWRAQVQHTEEFSWGAMGREALIGGLTGAATAGIGQIPGVRQLANRATTAISNRISPYLGRPPTTTLRPTEGPIAWPPNNGFHGNLGPSGNPGVTVLRPGTQIDRFGLDEGRFVAPRGTPVAQRSLPPGATSKPYSVFEVTNRLVVQQGRATPWFGQPGMGVQYRLPASVKDLLATGYLRRV